MKKKEETKSIYAGNEIATKDGTRTYPVDFVREYFVNTDKSVEELAIQLNLPTEVVEHHARQGMQSWYALKHEKLAERLAHFLNVNIDNLTETHSLLEDGHFLKIVQLKSQQEYLKGYYLKNGHLFRIEEDGEISKDSYGLPIPLPLPDSPKDFMVLEAFLKIKEGTKQALNQVYEQTKKDSKKPEVIDVDAYFEEKDE